MANSTEAPFSFTTKINGDLFTVRGGDFHEFAQNLTLATDDIDKIVERVASIQAAGNAASLVNRQAPSAPPAAAGGWNGPKPAAPAAPQGGGSPQCDCGIPAKLIPAGVSKNTGKPYRAFYACAQPRGQQCEFRASV